MRTSSSEELLGNLKLMIGKLVQLSETKDGQVARLVLSTFTARFLIATGTRGRSEECVDCQELRQDERRNVCGDARTRGVKPRIKIVEHATRVETRVIKECRLAIHERAPIVPPLAFAQSQRDTCHSSVMGANFKS